MIFNFFRIVADLCHLLSFGILMQRLHFTRNARGISLKSQELFLLVFLTRYSDIFFNHTSIYNTVFKLVYIGASGYVVYALRYKEPFKYVGLTTLPYPTLPYSGHHHHHHHHYRSTYEESRDTFYHIKYGVAPCAGLALVFNYAKWGMPFFFYIWHYLWAFSIFLEAIAIFPQLVMFTRDKDSENITSHYLAALGVYRGLYLLNWASRFITEGYFDPIKWVGGLIQTGLYADFFYHYYQRYVVYGRARSVA